MPYLQLDAQEKLIKFKPEKQQKEEMFFFGQHSIVWLGHTLFNQPLIIEHMMCFFSLIKNPTMSKNELSILWV